MEDHPIIDALADTLRAIGFSVEAHHSTAALDGAVTLERGGARRSYVVEVKTPLTASEVAPKGASGDVLYVTDL